MRAKSVRAETRQEDKTDGKGGNGWIFSLVSLVPNLGSAEGRGNVVFLFLFIVSCWDVLSV